VSAFDCFLKKEELISRAYDIDEDLYSILKNISSTRYNCSISNLVNVAIKNLIDTEKIISYERNKNLGKIHRSFLINKSCFDGLENLKDKYKIPICQLVNIAIYISLE
jgi:hypothetical protein